MTFDLMHIWANMGLISKLIAGVLLVMALASIAVTIERMIALSQSSAASRSFAPAASALVEQGDFSSVVKLAERSKKSALARLFSETCARYVSAARKPEGGITPVEVARADALRNQDALSGELRRGMSVLATVGSVSPFIGLLGTVMGIISAFQGIKDAGGGGGLGAVSVGISEALVETALGLMVAIPAVIAFNYLSQRMNAIEGALARSTGRLLDEMEYHHGRRHQTDAAPLAKAAA